MALEYGVEIVGISEAGSFRNFADRHVGLLKKFRRLIQTQTAQIGRNAAAGGSLENILNVRRGQTDMIGQRINIQLWIGIVALDIADDRVNIVAAVVNAGKCTGDVLHQIQKQPLDCAGRFRTQNLRAEARGVIFHRHGIGTLERCDIFRNACNQQIQRIRHICCRFEPCVKEARKRCSGIVKALGAESLYYLTADLLCLCLAKGRTCIQLCAGNKVTGGIEIQQIQPLVQCAVGCGKLIDGRNSIAPDARDGKLRGFRERCAKRLGKRLRVYRIRLLTDKEEPALQHIDQFIACPLRQRLVQLLLQQKMRSAVRHILIVIRKLPLPELEQEQRKAGILLQLDAIVGKLPPDDKIAASERKKAAENGVLDIAVVFGVALFRKRILRLKRSIFTVDTDCQIDGDQYGEYHDAQIEQQKPARQRTEL